ncbi:MAG: XRE family transcriptional regulator [Firmicutes bacterium]|nr:XRE family transcriptional regulator [Bacillota bacterium]
MTTIERVFALMKQRGVTQYRLSKDIGISEGVFSSWKKNTQKPSTDVVIKVAEYFNVTTDYLLGVTENPETSAATGRDHSKDETDLVFTYRQLTPNSKQIVLTVAQMELRHVRATAQGETPIKIIPPKKHGELLKVYNQPAAAGYGTYLSDDCDGDYEMVSVPSIPVGVEFGIRIQGDSMEPRISDGEIVYVKRQPAVEIGEIGIFIYNGEAYCKKLAYRDNYYYLRSLNSEYEDIPISSDDIYCVGKVVPG